MQAQPEFDLEDEDETLFYWANIGFDVFIQKANEMGYPIDGSFETLDVLERYIRTEKPNQTDSSDEGMLKFVGCYMYLGLVVKRHFDAEWVLVDDGSADSGMLGLVKLMIKYPEIYWVPRNVVIAMTEGMMEEESLYQELEAFRNYDGSESIEGLEPEV